MNYDDIVNKIYQDLPTSNIKGISFNVEKVFIDTKNNIIVFLIYSTILEDIISYYYGLFDNAKKDIISYKSKEYQEYISNMPSPEHLQIKDLEEFMENRLEKRKEKKILDEYISTNVLSEDYYDILNSLLNRAINKKTIDILSFFEKETKEKRKEEDFTETHIIDPVNVVKETNNPINHYNNREIFKQKQIELQNKPKTVKTPKEEKSHKTEILFMTIVAIILGLLTATIVAGPWNINNVFP